jgi:ATP-dependent DNA helicase RecQ
LLHRHHIFSYQARKSNPQVVLLQGRMKREELRLDEKFIAERKQEYIARLEAMRHYVTENNVCRTRLLVHYFGEASANDCRICDVCVARKRAGLSAAEFSVIMKQLEDVLSKEALLPEALYLQLNLKKENLTSAIEYLLEAGRISKTEQGTLHWVS